MHLWLLAAALAFAQDSYWVELPPEGGTSEGNVSAPDKVEFWDKLQEKSFDEFCKLVQIPVGYTLGIGDYADVSARYRRSLKRMPDGRFAVVDEAKLGLGLRYNVPLTGDELPVNFGVHSSLQGESVVVRPLPGKRSCQEVDTVLKVWDAKTVLPLKGKRISEMMVGELWRLPLTLTVGGGFSLGRELIEALPISITLGSSAQGRASVSLKRLSQNEVRMRLRLDQATIRDLQGNIVADVASSILGTPDVENILMKFLMREASKQLNKYLALTLSGSRNTRKGVNTVLEFILDPENPDQMDKLSRALSGELGVLEELERLAKLARDRATKANDSKVDLMEVSGRMETAIGKDTTFAGLDDYERKRRGMVFKIPLIFDIGGSSAEDKDRIVLLDEEGGEYDISRADKRRERGLFDIPLIGQVKKTHRERSARVFTYRDKDGAVSDPMAIYVEQSGFLRRGDGTAFELARRSDEMLQLLGTKGRGRNLKAALPMALVAPDPNADKKTWKRGLSTLTVGFSPKAVTDIIASTAETVLRAVANVHESSLAMTMVEWALSHGTWNKEGELEYDSFRLAEALGLRWGGDRNDDERQRAWAIMRGLVSDAADIMKDFAAAAMAPTPQKRAEKFLEIMKGDGESGMEYEEIMRILVQLVDPMDVSAEYFTQISRDKQDIKARLALHGAKQDPRIEAMARARNRFIEPTFLSD